MSHRYLVEGIARDVAEGKSVVIVAITRSEALKLHHQVIEHAGPDSWRRIVKAHGAECADHVGGGSLRPLAVTASLRGRRVDVLVIRDFRHMTDAQQSELLASAPMAGEMQIIE